MTERETVTQRESEREKDRGREREKERKRKRERETQKLSKIIRKQLYYLFLSSIMIITRVI